MFMPNKNAKIFSVETDKVIICLDGCERAEIASVLSVVGIEEHGELWFDYMAGKLTNVSWCNCKKNSEVGGGFVKFEIEDSDYIAPYLKRLKEVTGFDWPAELEYSIACMREIRHTHAYSEAKIVAGRKLKVTAVDCAYPRVGQEFKTHAEAEAAARRNVTQYLHEALGTTQHEPEFIQDGRGKYDRNPNWGTGRPAKTSPGCTSEILWQELFGFWAENYATPEQKAILARQASFRGRKEKWPSLMDYQGIYLDDYKTHISYADFAASKVPELPLAAGLGI